MNRSRSSCLPARRRVRRGARIAVILCAAAMLVLGVLLNLGDDAGMPPAVVFSVDTPYPTEDKPQSKLWFAHGHWWAWLPDGNASSIWRRTSGGWQRQTSLDDWLRQVPGRADVWPQADLVRAVLVADTQLATASLRYQPETGGYQPQGAPVIWPTASPQTTRERTADPVDDSAAWWSAYEQSEKPIESATIARDGNGIWWIAYDFQRAIWVRYSLAADGLRWGEPIRIGGPISPDDIGVIFALPGSIGLVWGHQSSGDDDGVYFRNHLDGDPPQRWQDVIAVERGYKVAEDHFNAAVSADGRVYVVSKDNKDIVGQGQLVLRVRETDGSWKNLPYATRTESVMPTRPIALVGGHPARLLLVHSLYPRGGPRPEHFIVYRAVDTTLTSLQASDSVLIPARKGTDIRNATSTRQALEATPWIVLASDKSGNVYEGIIGDTGGAAPPDGETAAD